eukprot:416691-Pleurochrysis_carterae.AAC.2
MSAAWRRRKHQQHSTRGRVRPQGCATRRAEQAPMTERAFIRQYLDFVIPVLLRFQETRDGICGLLRRTRCPRRLSAERKACTRLRSSWQWRRSLRMRSCARVVRVHARVRVRVRVRALARACARR